MAKQAAIIEQLRERIQELETRLAKDSHNCTKPLPWDPPFRKPPPRSWRKPSGRKPGEQKDRGRATRALADAPDHVAIVPLAGTCACRRCRGDINAEALVRVYIGVTHDQPLRGC